MNTTKTLSKTFLIIAAAGILAATILACAATPATPVDTPAPLVQVVTRLVNQEVTQVVTKIVEVQVTVTPGPTQEPTSTPDPSGAAANTYPLAILPEYTDCLYGPAAWFVYKTSFPAGGQVEVVGRSADGNWVNIEEVGGWNSCWIEATQAQLQASRVEDLPVVSTMLPKSALEFGSPLTTTAKREGDEVTVAWEAVYMSSDEVQGYLIEARLCKGGQLTDQQIFVPVTFEQNVGTISVKVKDEAGCAEPSTAHIISMGKRGFAEWEKIFWPAQN